MSYPFIRFVCRYGRVLALCSALLGLLLSALLAYHAQSYTLFLVGGILSALMGALARLVSEIVEVVADALLPR